MTPQEIEALRSEALKDKVDALSDMVELLKDERDALAAKLAKIAVAWLAAGSWPDTAEEMKEISAALLSDPQQCLRDVQAEAGRLGFLEGVRQMCDNEIGWFGHDADSCANHYATKVRQGSA